MTKITMWFHLRQKDKVKSKDFMTIIFQYCKNHFLRWNKYFKCKSKNINIKIAPSSIISIIKYSTKPYLSQNSKCFCPQKNLNPRDINLVPYLVFYCKKHMFSRIFISVIVTSISLPLLYFNWSFYYAAIYCNGLL